MKVEGADGVDTTEGAPVEVEVPQTITEFRAAFPQAPSRHAPPSKEPSEPIEKPRHRAKSQQAGPDDAAAIAAQTKRLREAEDSVEVPRIDGESDRVYGIRKRAEIAELAKGAKQPPKVQPVAAAVSQPAAIVQPSEFKDPQPQIAQFSNTDDPYGNHQRALMKWELKKDDFDAKQAETKTKSEQAQKQQREEFDTYIKTEQTAHDSRLGDFIKNTPDAKQVMEGAADIPLTLAMRGAMELHAQGPQMMYALAKSPELADELFLLTAGRYIGDPRTDPLVAIVRRRLLQRVQAATAGSAAPLRQTTVAPRPPNPARTVPQTPREKPSVEPVGSLAEHRQRFPTR